VNSRIPEVSYPPIFSTIMRKLSTVCLLPSKFYLSDSFLSPLHRSYGFFPPYLHNGGDLMFVRSGVGALFSWFFSVLGYSLLLPNTRFACSPQFLETQVPPPKPRARKEFFHTCLFLPAISISIPPFFFFAIDPVISWVFQAGFLNTCCSFFCVILIPSLWVLIVLRA